MDPLTKQCYPGISGSVVNSLLNYRFSSEEGPLFFFSTMGVLQKMRLFIVIRLVVFKRKNK